jgi:tetratricopeptide (TPR) repeat protein
MRIFGLATLLISVGCASLNNPRAIKEENFDGLKFESLKRYDSNRLTTSLQKNDPLALCHSGEFEKANEIFKKKLDKNLNNYKYWNQISTCYILQGKHTQAKRFLNLALGTAKTNIQKSSVINNIGVIHLKNQNYQEAKDYFKKAIELSKKSMTPRYNLAQIYLKFTFYKKAKIELTELLHSNNKDIDFLNSMAHLSLMEKKYQDSLRYFKQIPTEYHSRDDIATNLAMVYFMLGNYDFAKQTLGKSDKKDSFYISSQSEMLKKIEKKVKAGKLQ